MRDPRGQDLEARAINDYWCNGVQVLLRTATHMVEPVILKEVNREEVCGREIEPTFRLTRHQAQALMDDLYHAGLRPTQAVTGSGEAVALRGHLADMRRIAFKSLMIDEPSK